MERLLTTKDLADAIGASESSLRRWTNSGAIRTSKTVGGHRRIPLSEAFRFIRESHSTVIRPDILGLDVAPDREQLTDNQSIHQALLSGNASRAQGEILSLYLEGASLATIFDKAIQPSLQQIGQLWQHDAKGILVEHRAIDICLLAINTLRQSVAPAPANAPVAVGGAPSGDPYLLPSLMAATVLAEAGYREINYGPETPLDVLAMAAEEHNASLVWLSISQRDAKALLQKGIERLAGQLAGANIQLTVGGRHAAELDFRHIPNVHYLSTMSELTAFSRGAAVATPS